MAFVGQRINHTCTKCGKSFATYENITWIYPICDDCKKIEEREKKQKWLNERRANKTLEERVAQLEEFMYNQKNHEHFDPHKMVF